MSEEMLDKENGREELPSVEELLHETVPTGSEPAETVATEAVAAEPAESPEEKRRKKRKAFIGDVVFFVVSFIVIYVLFTIFPPYYVDGNSMNQTLKNRAFGFGTILFQPDYGDIVVLHGDSGKTNDNDFIKRVVGKPGDVLDITDGVLVRNGEEVKEDYAYYDPDYTYRSGVTQHIVLGEGQYFVMGDNRFHSMDSRSFGPITREEMKCKMMFFLWGKKR
jgi:signal peptidase I